MSTTNTKQAAWVAIGSFCSFIVGIVSPMILSRFFNKGDYGTYKQVMYIYNTLLTVFTLGLPKAYAYFLPKVPATQAKDIIKKITGIFFVLGGVFSLFLFFCSSPIANLLENPDLGLAIKIFAPVPLFLLPTIGLDGIYATFQKTEVLAIYTVATRILTIICIILPVILFNGNYVDALIGFNIASLISCIIALYMKSWPVKEQPKEKSDVNYRKIFNFSLPLLYASLWGTIISSANQFFISRYYGNEVFAEFSNGFMEIPFVGMVIGGIGTVLLPLFSGMDKGAWMTENIRELWMSSLEKSAKIIFPMLIYSVFFAKIIMTCMYGNLYENSSLYFQIKNISGLLFIIPFAPIILALGKTKEYANVHMVIAFLIVILEYLTVKLFDTPIAIAIVSEACQCLKITLLLKMIANYLKMSINKLLPWEKLGKCLFVSVATGILSYCAILPLHVNKFIALFLSFIFYVVFYYILCWFMKISYKSLAVSLVKKLDGTKWIKYIP